VLRGVVRLLALALAVAGAVRLGANLTSDEVPEEGSADVGFARDMRAHHGQAVEMAELLRDRTRDEDLRALAADVALTQQAQIGQMRGWLDAWGLPPTSTDDPMSWAPQHAGRDRDGGMPGLASEGEIDQLRSSSGDGAEVLFLRLMIRHHEGGVHMALLATEAVEQDEVRALARTIAESQQTEIRYLAGLLAARHAEPLPSILPEDLSALAEGLGVDGSGGDSLAEIVARWWLVATGGLALAFLIREMVRRAPARAATAATAPRRRPRRARRRSGETTIDAEEPPLATVATAPDELDRGSHHPQRDDWNDERPLDDDRFPVDDSSFDDV
jgi:uncharacterized protein (DUF305 family)